MLPAPTPTNLTCAPCDGSSSIRWGILACGNISTKFATAVASCPEAGRVSAVASRSLDRAREFVADLTGLTSSQDIQCFDNYTDLATCNDVDVVYIGSPHSHHFQHAMLCLRNDKHVLCEKSFTINAEQARELVDVARERGLFLMEAMWTRFFPAITDELLPRIARGDIGEVVAIEASFGFNASNLSESHRLFNPELGGGALLDVGVYVVSLASLLLGHGQPPSVVQGVCEKSTSGIDVQNGISLLYSTPRGNKGDNNSDDKGQRTATLSSSLRARLRGEAIVIGTTGQIHLKYPFWRTSSLSLWSADTSSSHLAPTSTEKIICDYKGSGMQFEALEVARCIASGRLESEMMPLHETVTVMETMDKLRAMWGVRYSNTLESTLYNE